MDRDRVGDGETLAEPGEQLADDVFAAVSSQGGSFTRSASAEVGKAGMWRVSRLTIIPGRQAQSQTRTRRI
jgi:hypothetical protein